MKKWVSLFLVVLLAFSLVACTQKPETETPEVVVDRSVLARVNGQVISMETFEKTFALVEYTYKTSYGEDVLTQEYNGRTIGDIIKTQILENLILDVLRVEAVTKAGGTVEQEKIDDAYTKYYDAEVKPNAAVQTLFEEKGIDETFIKSQIESQLLADLFVENVKTNNAEALQLDEAAFDNVVAKVRARHILVDTKEEADAVIARISAGETFEDVAKEVSADPGSGAEGGDLGFFMYQDMVEPFAEAAFTLPVGQVSEPVESQFGYHVIRVDEIKKISDLKAEEGTEQDVETVRMNMTNQLLSDILDKEIQALIGSATIERFDELLETQPSTSK